MVSTVSVPLPPDVFTNPFEVRLEILPRASAPMFAVVAKRLVLEAVVEKKLVVVAEVPVAVVNVRLWKVEEALAQRLVVLKSPVEVALPVVRLVEKRFVEEAVEAKELVVVAEVVVELPVMMRFASMVEEAVERKPFRKPRRVEVETP